MIGLVTAHLTHEDPRIWCDATKGRADGVGTSSGANKDRSSIKKDGLGIDRCQGESQHFGAPLFQRGEYAVHELDQPAQRHPEYNCPEQTPINVRIGVWRTIRSVDDWLVRRDEAEAS